METKEIEERYQFLAAQNQRYVKEDFARKTNSYPFFFTENTAIVISEKPRFQLYINKDLLHYKRLLELFEEKVENRNEAQQVFSVVEQTVREILGGFSHNEQKRIRTYYPQLAAKILHFQGRGISGCSERAALAHNLFKFLGFESYFISSPVRIDGDYSLHNFNIVRVGKQHHIFDLALGGSKEVNGEIVKVPFIKTLTQNEVEALRLNPAKQEEKVLNRAIEQVAITTLNDRQYRVDYCTYNNLDKVVFDQKEQAF